MIGLDTMVAELILQVAGLKSEVARLTDVVSGSPAFVEGWTTGKDAAIALRNEGVKSADHLKKLRLDGAFTEGRDIRNTSKGDRPTWEYHIPNCRKALQRHFKSAPK
jgi:hypothetical protein